MATITAGLAGGQAVVDFLDLISFSEGADYNTIVTGVDGPETFTDFTHHPFLHRQAKLIRVDPPLFSSAAGRYQVLLRWCLAYQAMLNLPDFSAMSQDRIALQQIKERNAIAPLLAGDVQTAVLRCSNIWASLPGPTAYGQPQHSMDVILEKYQQIATATDEA